MLLLFGYDLQILERKRCDRKKLCICALPAWQISFAMSEPGIAIPRVSVVYTRPKKVATAKVVGPPSFFHLPVQLRPAASVGGLPLRCRRAATAGDATSKERLVTKQNDKTAHLNTTAPSLLRSRRYLLDCWSGERRERRARWVNFGPVP